MGANHACYQTILLITLIIYAYIWLESKRIPESSSTEETLNELMSVEYFQETHDEAYGAFGVRKFNSKCGRKNYYIKNIKSRAYRVDTCSVI